MMCNGFNGRKRRYGYNSGTLEWKVWGIVNMERYVNGEDDCFIKEVPISDEEGGYMTYECGHDSTEASYYKDEETAQRMIEVYHMPKRTYLPIEVIKKLDYSIDTNRRFTIGA